MKRWNDLALAVVILACGATGWYLFPTLTPRAAILTAGLCLVAMRYPYGLSMLRRRETSPPKEPETPPPMLDPRPVRKTTRLANDTGEFVERMIAQGRTALLLRSQIAASLSEEELAAANAEYEEIAATVPAGLVAITPRGLEGGSSGGPRSERIVSVACFLLDRYPVTNRDFHAFVADGGYQQISLWEPAIWPAVVQFTDRSGNPGPSGWQHGEFPQQLEDHPVVGVSWFEAMAYARWVGKRLPTDAEWCKAAAWPVAEANAHPRQQRYPWGDTMDHRLANLWGGPGTTTPVFQYPDGCAPNGVYDLIGNVWEWTSSPFDEFAPPRLRWDTTTPLRSIRGGAFDTYFDTQATTTFASGADPFLRGHNIGFRCALSLSDLQLADVSDSDDSDTEFSEEDA